MKERLDRYKRVFGSEDGKAVLADLAKECGVFTTHVKGKVIDPNYMMFKEGERNVVLRIITVLEYDLNDFRTLAK